MKLTATLTAAGIAASSLLAALATAQPQPRYSIIDLGTLPGGTSGIANS